MSRRGALVGTLLVGIGILGYGFSLDLSGGVDYQLVSFPELTAAVVDPLNQAISLLNDSLPAGTGTISSLPPVSGAWGQALGARLWFSNLWGVGFYFLHSSAETSATSTLNVDSADIGNFKLDVSYKLAVSGVGGGIGTLWQVSFGPITGTAEVKALYLLGRLGAGVALRAYDFSGVEVESPSDLSATLNTGYQATGLGYEVTAMIKYTFGQCDIGLLLGYRNVPLTFGDLDGDGMREHANLNGFIIGGQIALGL